MATHRRHLPSKPPGTLMAPEGAVIPASAQVIHYTPEGVREFEVGAIDELDGEMLSRGVTWLNLNGLGNLSLIEGLRDKLGFHPLALEDVLHAAQRPKIEDYPNHLYVVLRMLTYDGALEAEQLSVFLHGNLVVTIQEREGDCLEGLRQRIRSGGGQVRGMGADYLLYAMADAVIDSYFPLLENLGDAIESYEDTLVLQADEGVITDIHRLRRCLLGMRRVVWPLREAVNALARDSHPQISEPVRLYLRDCYDHTVQVLDLLESYRELAAGLMELYLSTVSNRMNEVMKVLTIIATIFIPITFVAGVYGMNFEHMPELKARWAYPAVWAVMLAAVAAMLLYFRRKGWLSKSRTTPLEEDPAPPDPRPGAPGTPP